MSKLILNVIWYAGSAAHTSLSLSLCACWLSTYLLYGKAPFVLLWGLNPTPLVLLYCTAFLCSLRLPQTAFLMPVKLPLVPNWELLTIYTKLTHCLYQADSLSTPSWLTVYTKLTHCLHQADSPSIPSWLTVYTKLTSPSSFFGWFKSVDDVQTLILRDSLHL